MHLIELIDIHTNTFPNHSIPKNEMKVTRSFIEGNEFKVEKHIKSSFDLYVFNFF